MTQIDLAEPTALASSPGLLSGRERRALGARLTVALVAGGLLVISLLLRLGGPDRAPVAQLAAGIAALLVAVPALQAAWHSLLHPDLHGVTDLLIALALVAAWATGDLVTAALLPLVMIVGHVLEERSLIGSQEAIDAIGRLLRTSARRQRPDGAIEEVPAEALQLGDLVEIRPGDRVPADGLVRHGRSSLDTAPITGEAAPREVAAGDRVHGGSVNLDGHLVVEITHVGAETTLGQIVALMQAAETSKPPVARLLERYAGRYIVLVLLVAGGIWLATHDSAAMLAVLVASCPCALILAAPATAVAAIAVAGRHGILIKGTAFLEELAFVDSVILDKTGTVTLGTLSLSDIHPESGVDRADLLAVAGGLAATSSHPVSRAVAAAVPAARRIAVDESREYPGLGVVGRCAGAEIVLGRPQLFADLGIASAKLPDYDGPLVGVARQGRFLGWLLLADQPRRDAVEAVRDLETLGLRRQLLLTGDRASEARRIAGLLAIPEVLAEALPDDKLRRVQEEVRAGRRPMIVGDGINDALALKAGAVGVAMGVRGTDIAIASADIVVMTDDLRRLGTCVRLSRLCRRTIHTNVAISALWTLAIIALAAGGVLGAEGAVVAAILHNVGTLLVIANAGRLLKFDESGGAATRG